MSKPDTVHNLVIDSPETKARAKFIIEMLDISKPWRLDLRVSKHNRSLDQNALYRSWLRIIASHLGYDENELHEHFKSRFVVRIYERDDRDFQEQIQLLRQTYLAGVKEQALKLKESICRRVSTTFLTTAQFSEFMDCVETFAGELGISLPQPEPKEEKR